MAIKSDFASVHGFGAHTYSVSGGTLVVKLAADVEQGEIVLADAVMLREVVFSGESLATNVWYDAAGNVIKQQAAGSNTFTKMLYDGVGRAIAQYVGYDTNETTSDLYIHPNLDLGDDTILEQSEYAYNAAGGMYFATLRQRKSDASDLGELDADNSRTTYTGSWFDGIGRPVAAADYGDNDGDTMTPGSQAATVYAWNNIFGILVARTEYNAQGQAEWSFDPLNRKTQTEYDAAGRVTKTVQNYVDGDPETGTSDQDVTMLTTYTADGQIDTFTAVNPSTGNQVTRYAYGTTLAESGVARTDLLRGVIYPDSTNTFTMQDGAPVFSGVYDRVEYEYNRLGQQVQVKDQNQTVHEYLFDKLGRLTEDCATELGTGVDGAVRRIERTYEVRGMVAHTTSYDNPNVGQGNVVNDVLDEYDEWGLLAKEYQAHDGPVNTLTTPYVGYDYADAAHGLRLESVRYANGRTVHFDYGTSDGMNDILNRLDSIKDSDDSTVLASYKYLGLNTIVTEDYEHAQVKLDYTDGSGNLNGFDRFGRVIDQVWKQYDGQTSTPIDEYKYGYDQSGNRLWKENAVSKTLQTPVYLDELYQYDGANRLTVASRGQLNGTKTAILNEVFSQDWNLDSLGNNLAAGSYNAANEETPTGMTGPLYDAAGNMISLQSGKTAKYDAWNRMVEVKEVSTVKQKNEYDGQNRRIQIFTAFDVNGNPTTVQDEYLNGQQVIESDKKENGSAAGGYQYLWSPRYIDAPILRDTLSTDQSAIQLPERIFYLGDANYNVTGVVKKNQTTGQWEISERNAYKPYGEVLYFNPDWSAANSSANANTILYTGRTLDVLTALYYYRARFYDAVLERFIGRDPIESDLNLYRYCTNDPIGHSDPSGLVTCQIKIWAGDTRDSHKALENLLKNNTGKKAGGADCPSKYLGVIGCGKYGPGGTNDKFPPLPPIPGDQRIPGFPQMPEKLPYDQLVQMLQEGLKSARDLAKQLCDNYKKKPCDANDESPCGANNQSCDKVTISVWLDVTAVSVLRETKEGEALLEQINEIWRKGEKLDCKK